jgi:hypothetical protein
MDTAPRGPWFEGELGRRIEFRDTGGHLTRSTRVGNPFWRRSNPGYPGAVDVDGQHKAERYRPFAFCSRAAGDFPNRRLTGHACSPGNGGPRRPDLGAAIRTPFLNPTGHHAGCLARERQTPFRPGRQVVTVAPVPPSRWTTADRARPLAHTNSPYTVTHLPLTCDLPHSSKGCTGPHEFLMDQGSKESRTPFSNGGRTSTYRVMRPPVPQDWFRLPHRPRAEAQVGHAVLVGPGVRSVVVTARGCRCRHPPLGVVFKCHAHIRSDARVTAAW